MMYEADPQMHIAPNLSLDADGRIDDDVPCLGCGYNLRTLQPVGYCPECGLPVEKSVHGGLLRFSDPAWVRSLASGANWIVASIVLGILLGCVGGGVGWSTARTGPGNTEGAAAIGMLLGLIPQIVAWIGYWRVTTRDPVRRDDESTFSARRLVRYWVVFSIMEIPFAWLAEQASSEAAESWSVFSGIVGILGMFALFIHARSLALRMPNEKLAGHTMMVMWGMVATMVLGVAIAAMALSGMPGGPNAPFSPLVILVGLFGLSMLVFMILALSLILRYRKWLNRAADEAEAIGLSPQPAYSHPPTVRSY